MGDPTPTPEGFGDEPRRIEIKNPYNEEDGLFPAEVQWVSVNRHTVGQDGGHTVEPLNDTALKTIAVTRYAGENPAGNVQLAGALQIEANKDHLAIESRTRQKDAASPEEYKNIEMKAAGGKAPAGSAKAKAGAGVGYRKGQGPGGAPKDDDGLLKSGNRRRSSGGKRKRDEDEERQTPQINLVFSPN